MAPKGDPLKVRRALNWSKEEEAVLVDAVMPHYEKLFGAHSKVVTEIQKKSLWAAVEATVNAVSPELRTLENIKKKWVKLKSDAKQSGATAFRKKRKTGGGETDDEEVSATSNKILGMSSVTKRIIEKIGPTAFKGIEGGIDTTALPGPSKKPKVETDIETDDFALVLVDTNAGRDYQQNTPEENLEPQNDTEVIEEVSKTPNHFQCRSRKSVTAAREVNKVGTNLINIENTKINLLRETNVLLLRIAEGIEEMVSLGKDKFT